MLPAEADRGALGGGCLRTSGGGSDDCDRGHGRGGARSPPHRSRASRARRRQLGADLGLRGGPPDLRAKPVLDEYGFGGYLIFSHVRPFITARRALWR